MPSQGNSSAINEVVDAYASLLVVRMLPRLSCARYLCIRFKATLNPPNDAFSLYIAQSHNETEVYYAC